MDHLSTIPWEIICCSPITILRLSVHLPRGRYCHHRHHNRHHHRCCCRRWCHHFCCHHTHYLFAIISHPPTPTQQQPQRSCLLFMASEDPDDSMLTVVSLGIPVPKYGHDQNDSDLAIIVVPRCHSEISFMPRLLGITSSWSKSAPHIPISWAKVAHFLIAKTNCNALSGHAPWSPEGTNNIPHVFTANVVFGTRIPQWLGLFSTKCHFRMWIYLFKRLNFWKIRYHPQICGVSQKSILRPLSFIFYINSLYGAINNSEVFLCADNCVIIMPGTCEHTIIDKSNNARSSAAFWLRHPWLIYI